MKTYTCSFCGKTQNDTEKMIVSRGMNITNDVCVCADCVSMMYAVLTQEKQAETYNTATLKKPSEIKQWLDEYIISQEDAKKAVATALYEHLKRIQYNDNLDKGQDMLERGSLFVIGQSGSGLQNINLYTV